MLLGYYEEIKDGKLWVGVLEKLSVCEELAECGSYVVCFYFNEINDVGRREGYDVDSFCECSGLKVGFGGWCFDGCFCELANFDVEVKADVLFRWWSIEESAEDYGITA